MGAASNPEILAPQSGDVEGGRVTAFARSMILGGTRPLIPYRRMPENGSSPSTHYPASSGLLLVGAASLPLAPVHPADHAHDSSRGRLAGQAGTHRRADSWAWRAMPTCRSLLPQAMRRADSRADCTAVRTSPTSTATIAITTNSSTSEKPRGGRVRAVGMEQESPRRARRPVEWAESPLAGLSFTPAQIVPPETVLPTGGQGG